jgi:uncharacterized protein (TIGR00252 family)
MRASAGTDRPQTGAAAENSAAAFLESQGFEIVARNFQLRVGELDVVARAGDLLVVAEVRTRSSEEFGGAAASISRCNGASPAPRRCSSTNIPNSSAAWCDST